MRLSQNLLGGAHRDPERIAADIKHSIIKI